MFCSLFLHGSVSLPWAKVNMGFTSRRECMAKRLHSSGNVCLPNWVSHEQDSLILRTECFRDGGLAWERYSERCINQHLYRYSYLWPKNTFEPLSTRWLYVLQWFGIPRALPVNRGQTIETIWCSSVALLEVRPIPPARKFGHLFC